MSFDVEIHKDKGRRIHLDVSFCGGSMWLFVHTDDDDDFGRAWHYRVPIGALRKMAHHINAHLEAYTGHDTDGDGELVKP